MIRKWILLGFSLIGLSACTDRSLQIGFLSSIADSGTYLKIENENTSGEIVVAANGDIPFKVSCGQSISDIEIFDQNLQAWVAVNVAQTAAVVSCPGQDSNFSISSEQILTTHSGSQPSSTTVEFKLRWSVNKRGSDIKEVVVKDLKAVFKAPTPQAVVLSNINIESSHLGPYVVQGDCIVNDATISFESQGLLFETQCALKRFRFEIQQSQISEGLVSFALKHFDVSTRTYALTHHSFLVDRIAPNLSAATPPAVLRAVDGNSYQIQGQCSEAMMSVRALMAGIQIGSGQCTAAQTFAIDIPLTTQGTFVVDLNQEDALGNSKTISVSFFRDSVGPGTFSIMGIKETGGSSVGNVLTGLWPVVDFSTSLEAVKYTLKIKNKVTQAVLCENEGTGNSLQFNTCQLPQAGQFVVEAGAEDQYGNFTYALNSPFDFTTAYHIPAVSRVYAPTVGASYGLNGIVQFFVEYDRAVQVSGTPYMILVGGMDAIFTGLSADKKTLQFSSTVIPANMYVMPLTTEGTIGLNAGTIQSDNNPLIAANLNVPTTGANSLANWNLKIDSIVVDPLTFTLGGVPTYLDRSPMLNFTMPSFTGFQKVIFKVIQKNNGVTIYEGVSPAPASTLPVSLTAGLDYIVQAQVFDTSGRSSGVTMQEFTSFICPTNFVYINNIATGAVPFCVAKYEAKDSGGVTVFQAAGLPVAKSLNAAKTACTSIGAKYSLISNSQWQTIADLIYRTPSNWSSGQSGMGRIHRGNQQSISLAAVNEADQCAPTSAATCELYALRRTHYVSSSEFIWDFAGNAAEVVADLDTATYAALSSTATYVTQLSSIGTEVNTLYGRPAGVCLSPESNEYCGMGKVYMQTSMTAVFRGGSWNDGDSAGIYAAKRIAAATGIPSDGGFRCVYSQ